MPTMIGRLLSKAMPYAIAEFNRGRRSATTATARAGMGAIPHDKGVAFRVWAPFGSAVFAAGTFNQWSVTATPLASEGNGYWSADVPDVRGGWKYSMLSDSARSYASRTASIIGAGPHAQVGTSR